MIGQQRRAVLVAAPALALGVLATSAPADAATHTIHSTHSTQSAQRAPVVQTDKGALLGRQDDGVDSFLGIPYAAPPVGPLRWRPPQPHARWTGVRPATAFGNRCAALESPKGARSDAEDCLFVNVQPPTGVQAGRHLPVYVFIHGGGLVNGSSNQ